MGANGMNAIANLYKAAAVQGRRIEEEKKREEAMSAYVLHVFLPR
jgi:hypothetical protein